MPLTASFQKLWLLVIFAWTSFWLVVEPALAAVTNNPWPLNEQHFDYLVAGGGLAGLTVANRLSEDPNVKVLVVEAGNDDRNNPISYDVNRYGEVFGSNLYWSYQTTYQDLVKGTKAVGGGRTLGGSTSINGAAWNRGAKIQYDHIGALGNPGWSWQDLLKYMKKNEQYVPPGKPQTDLGATYDPSVHGSNGPLQITFTKVQGAQTASKRDVDVRRNLKRMFSGPQQNAFLQAIQKSLGVEKLVDQCNGIANGAAYTPNSVQTNGRRSSAATAYVDPVESRPNLTILTGSRIAKMWWDTVVENRVAGVYIQQQKDGAKQRIFADREVILATGAVQSPAILHRSGIGSQSDIGQIGYSPIRIELAGVGKNFQEQTMTTIGSRTQIDFGGQGPSNMIGMPNIYQILSNATAVKSYIESNFDGWANALVQQGHVVNQQSIKKQWQLNVEAIFDHKAPVAEMFFDTGYPANSLGIDIWPLLPWSRGSIRTVSKDPFDDPQVNPNYFALPIDMDIQVASLRSGRAVLDQPFLKQLTVQGETIPGFQHIPDGTNRGRYDRWRSWILGSDGTSGFSSVSHPIATCSMMPKEMGGVVDSSFRVYGTKNVRVVDASVLPMQVSAHLSATLYGIAEKAADVIKQTPPSK